MVVAINSLHTHKAFWFLCGCCPGGGKSDVLEWMEQSLAPPLVPEERLTVREKRSHIQCGLGLSLPGANHNGCHCYMR